MLLPHKKELIGFLPIADLYRYYATHERLQVFAEKGCICVACGRVGTFLALGRETRDNRQSRRQKSVGRVHIDLYTDDFVLMTVDHIVPKHEARLLEWTKKEIESLDNKQPMCEPCNGSKGSKLLALGQLQERRRNTNTIKGGTEVLRQLVPNIHALLGDIT